VLGGKERHGSGSGVAVQLWTKSVLGKESGLSVERDDRCSYGQEQRGCQSWCMTPRSGILLRTRDDRTTAYKAHRLSYRCTDSIFLSNTALAPHPYSTLLSPHTHIQQWLTPDNHTQHRPHSLTTIANTALIPASSSTKVSNNALALTDKEKRSLRNVARPSLIQLVK
jgi:hypothetical protein